MYISEDHFNFYSTNIWGCQIYPGAKTVVETDGNPKAASPVKVEISQKDISNTFLFDRETQTARVLLR